MSKINLDGVDDFSPEESAIAADKLATEAEKQAAGDLSPLELEQISKEVQARQKYGDSPAAAAAVAAAGSATFGLTDRFIQEFIDKDAPKKLKQYNPGSDLAGEVAGIIAPALATGGTSLLAKGVAAAGAPVGAALKTGQAVEKAVYKAIAETGMKNEAKRVVAKTAAMGAGGLTEGAILGAGQLAREEALGNVELSAENLLSHVGTGALFGGLLSAAVPVAGVTTKAGGRLFKQATKDLFDPELAAMRMHGFKSEKDINKLKLSLGEDAGEKVLNFVRKELDYKIGDDTAKHLQKIEAKRSLVGSQLDDFVEEFDATVSSQQPGIIARQRVTFNKAADDIETLLASKPATSGNRAERRALRDLAEDMRLRAAADEGLSARELWKLRQEYDKPLKTKFGQRIFDKDLDKANLIARRTLQDELLNSVKTAAPDRAQYFANLFDKYRITRTLQKQLEKSTPLADFAKKASDVVLGGIGYGLGDIPGLLLAGTKKLADSNFKNKLVVLSGIEKANENVSRRLKQAADTFLDKNIRKASRLASTKILMTSSLAAFEGEQPKNKEQAFQNIQKNLQELKADPSKLLERTVKAGSVISQYAPQTATVVGERLVRAVDFLDQKIPKPNHEAPSLTAYSRPFTPSSMQLAQFERYLQVIENPLSVMEDLEQGTLTREHVQALQQVYPMFYNRLREFMSERLQDYSEPLSYSKRVQVSILLDLVGDDSLIGKNIAALQSNLQPGEQEQASGQPMVKPTQGGASKITASERTASDTQAFAQRRNE